MAPKMETKQSVPWKKSNEKEILKQNILDGLVREDMNPEEVYNMHEGYKQFPYANFKRNLLCLHKTINRKKHQMIVGNVAFEKFKKTAAESYDRGNDTTEQSPWFSSEAKTLLMSDIEAGRHLGKNPKEIWQSRPEYQKFILNRFRNHYYTLKSKMTKKEKMKARKAAKGQTKQG